MKAIAHRPKGMQDLEGLLTVHPDADVVLVRQWVREFATATAWETELDEYYVLLDVLSVTAAL